MSVLLWSELLEMHLCQAWLQAPRPVDLQKSSKTVAPLD
jgi:hypothetical protein